LQGLEKKQHKFYVMWLGNKGPPMLSSSWFVIITNRDFLITQRYY